MNNMAIFTNPDGWFKQNENVSVQRRQSVNVDDDENEFKEFEYQHMNEHDEHVESLQGSNE